MIALAPGERLHKLSRTGQVLADFPTMVSDGAPQAGPVNRFHGPLHPEISPDGTKVAYEWFNDSFSNDSGLLGDLGAALLRLHARARASPSATPTATPGPRRSALLTGWIYPHWMSNDVLLRSFSGAVLNDDAVFTTVGPGWATASSIPGSSTSAASAWTTWSSRATCRRWSASPARAARSYARTAP